MGADGGYTQSLTGTPTPAQATPISVSLSCSTSSLLNDLFIYVSYDKCEVKATKEIATAFLNPLVLIFHFVALPENMPLSAVVTSPITGPLSPAEEVKDFLELLKDFPSQGKHLSQRAE